MFYLYNWNLIQTFKFIPCQLAQIRMCAVFSFVCPGTQHVCSVCVCECSILISKLIKIWKVTWKNRARFSIHESNKTNKVLRSQAIKKRGERRRPAGPAFIRRHQKRSKTKPNKGDWPRESGAAVTDGRSWWHPNDVIFPSNAVSLNKIFFPHGTLTS